MAVRNTVLRRSELTDGVLERIAPLLPENGRRGKQWKDHCMVVCRNPLVYAPLQYPKINPDIHLPE
jgi:hypothetical protein